LWAAWRPSVIKNAISFKNVQFSWPHLPEGIAKTEIRNQLRPDVILMNLGMPVMSGLEATRAIHQALPEAWVIRLSMYEESERAGAIPVARAALYMTKSMPAQDLIGAIRFCGHKPP
jgi:DNA-binding NarL/FixJ family response regulator